MILSSKGIILADSSFCFAVKIRIMILILFKEWNIGLFEFIRLTFSNKVLGVRGEDKGERY